MIFIENLEKPRERALKVGLGSLSDIELLALILRTGNKEVSVLELSYSILNKYPIKTLGELRLEELLEINGIGYSKAFCLLACFELNKRYVHRVNIRQKITKPSDCFDLLMLQTYNTSQEEFYTIYLNARKELIKIIKLYVGTVDCSLIHPREVFKHAVNLSASFIIVAHNHPTGNLKPSTQDIDVTTKLIECGNIFNIAVIDHLIFSSSEFVSLREIGLF